MRIYDIISKKIDKQKLSKAEIDFFVEKYSKGEIPDYQAAALLMAIYINKMDKEDDAIYYACGETISKIDMMPQVESLKDKNKEVLYLTDYVDELVLKMLDKYEDKKFVNVASNDFDLSSEEEKEALRKKREEERAAARKANKPTAAERLQRKATNKVENELLNMGVRQAKKFLKGFLK